MSQFPACERFLVFYVESPAPWAQRPSRRLWGTTVRVAAAEGTRQTSTPALGNEAPSSRMAPSCQSHRAESAGRTPRKEHANRAWSGARQRACAGETTLRRDGLKPVSARLPTIPSSRGRIATSNLPTGKSLQVAQLCQGGLAGTQTVPARSSNVCPACGKICRFRNRCAVPWRRPADNSATGGCPLVCSGPGKLCPC